MLVMITSPNSRHITAQIKHNHPAWTPDKWVNDLIKRNLEFIKRQKAIQIKRRKTMRTRPKTHHRGWHN